MRLMRTASVVVVAATLVASAVAPLAAGEEVDPGPDFNGDGYADLAVGVPREDVGDVEDGGAVGVIYGTFDGLNGDQPIDDQFWTQNSSGVQEAAEPFDRFGSALAAGDFDGDGFDDLAVGAPLEDVATAAGEITDGGIVQVLYGSSLGLTASDDLLLHQDVSGIEEAVESSDRYGFALESADLGRGTRDDLAIGVPGERINGLAGAGAVNVVYGSSVGLYSTGDLLWYQDSPGIPGVAESGDGFGSSLAAGEFGVSSEVDLAIGSPDEDLGSARDAGSVTVIYGSSTGLTSTGSKLWTQDSSGIAGGSESYDRFSFALATGDFGNSSHDDLAIGAPYEDLGDDDEGAVNVIYGSNSGLSQAGNQMWHQDSPNISGDSEKDDFVGYALAAADFGKGTRADLAIGAAGERKENSIGFNDNQTGAVNVIYGAAFGLNAAGQQFWWQDSSGIEGETEPYDRFGSALSAARFDGTGAADLAVGVPGEEYESDDDWYAGAVNVIYSGDSGLASADDQFWWQASDTLHDSAERGDHFGDSLAK